MSKYNEAADSDAHIMASIAARREPAMTTDASEPSASGQIPTPRTDAAEGRWYGDNGVAARFARELERENDTLRARMERAERERDEARRERDEFQAEWQKVCDHEWEHVDDSFDHEFGTEQVHSYVCEKCGATKPYEPETFGDEAI